MERSRRTLLRRVGQQSCYPGQEIVHGEGFRDNVILRAVSVLHVFIGGGHLPCLLQGRARAVQLVHWQSSQ